MIGYDRITNIGTTWTATSQTVSVRGGATMKGVLVCIVENGVTSSSITGVTYDGNALTQVSGSPQVHSTGETSALSVWFLGTGVVGSGDGVTVAVTSSSSTTTKSGSVIGLTSTLGYDLEVLGTQSVINSDSQANPSNTLTLGEIAYVVQVFHSGQDAVTGIGEATNWTNRRELDFGTSVWGLYTAQGWTDIEGVPTAIASITTGWTQTAEDANGFATAIKERTPIRYDFQITSGQTAYLTGQAATFSRTRVLTTSPGSFILTGQAAALLRGLFIACEPGTYVLTGNDAAFFRGYTLAAGAGTYVLTGNDASLLAQRLITTDAGTYTLTGLDASLLAQRTIGADAGSYALTGLDAGLTAQRALTAVPGEYVLSGQDAALLRGYVLPVDAGEYVLTGYDADFVRTASAAHGGGWYANKERRRNVERFRNDDEEVIALISAFIHTLD